MASLHLHSLVGVRDSSAILELTAQQSLFMPACGNGPSPVSSGEVLTVLESIDLFISVPI